MPLQPLPAQQSIDKLQEAKQADELVIKQWNPTMISRQSTKTLKKPRLALLSEQLQQMENVWEDFVGCEFGMTAQEDDSENLPKNYKLAMADEKWLAAMEREYNSLIDNETWDLVQLPERRRAFPCKWVYSWRCGAKQGEDARRGEMVVREKARLVARGDLQTPGVDFKETFAPVVKFVTFRVFLIFAAINDLEIRHWDVLSAFLQGTIDMDLYMKQPPGYDDNSGRVCKLKKSIYGLCQSARLFYLKLDSVLSELNFERASADWAIWVHRTDKAVLVCHVDDISIAGSVEFIAAMKDDIQKKLPIKDLDDLRIYINITVKRDRLKKKIFLLQEEYAKKMLQDFGMSNCHLVSMPMIDKPWDIWDTTSTFLTDKEKLRYQAAIGSLLYLMHGTRPDLTFSIIKLSQYLAKPMAHHWEGVKRIFRYIKGTLDTCLVLGDRKVEMGQCLDGDMESDDLKGLCGYFDSAHANNVSLKSTCGYIFLLYGSPISWVTKVQKIIALSSTEAEYMAGTEATKETIWLKSLMDVLFKDPGIPWPITLYGDNQGCLSLAKNPVFHSRTKHIKLRYRFITQAVQEGTIRVKHVPTKDELADGFTKPLSKEQHWNHMGRLGLKLGRMSGEREKGEEKKVAFVMDDNVLVFAAGKGKRKWECTRCGNLFKDGEALCKHMLKEEKRAKMKGACKGS